MAANLEPVGRALLWLGLLLLLTGALLMLAPKLPFLGRLPGDLHIRSKSFSFYLPLATCLALSVVLSLLIVFLRKK